MPEWVLTNGDGQELASIKGPDELETAFLSLPKLTGNTFAAATLTTDTGDYFHLGTDGKIGFVSHNPASGQPPYLIAVSDNRAVRPDEAVEFFYGVHSTEIDRRFCLPAATVIKILKEYFSARQLPAWVAWEEI
jgi:hypothetical protein